LPSGCKAKAPDAHQLDRRVSLAYHDFQWATSERTVGNTGKKAMNVTLHKKKRSGIWSRAERCHDLKSWQRLWLVTGVTYLLMLVATGWLLMPERRQVDKAMVLTITEEVRRYDGLAFVGDSPEKIFEIARAQGYDRWIAHVRKVYGIGREGDAGFGRIERDYRQAMETLTSRRLKLSVWLLAAWAAPMGLLYVMGGLVGWIKRGGP